MTHTGYHHGNLAPALVEAASHLLEQGGRSAVSMRALAESLGVSHAAPYRHFKSKRHLMTALAEAGCNNLGRALRMVDREGLPPRATLAKMAKRWCSFVSRQPECFRLMLITSNMTDKATHAPRRAIEKTLLQAGLGSQSEPGSWQLWSQWSGLGAAIAAGTLSQEHASQLAEKAIDTHPHLYPERREP